MSRYLNTYIFYTMQLSIPLLWLPLLSSSIKWENWGRLFSRLTSLVFGYPVSWVGGAPNSIPFCLLQGALPSLFPGLILCSSSVLLSLAVVTALPTHLCNCPSGCEFPKGDDSHLFAAMAVQCLECSSYQEISAEWIQVWLHGYIKKAPKTRKNAWESHWASRTPEFSAHVVLVQAFDWATWRKQFKAIISPWPTSLTPHGQSPKICKGFSVSISLLTELETEMAITLTNKIAVQSPHFWPHIVTPSGSVSQRERVCHNFSARSMNKGCQVEKWCTFSCNRPESGSRGGRVISSWLLYSAIQVPKWPDL